MSQLAPLQTRHRTVLRLSLMNMSNREIAEQLGMNEMTVGEIINSPMGQAEMARMQDIVLEKCTDLSARIKQLAIPAVDVIESIIKFEAVGSVDPTTVTPMRLKAAENAVDRAGFKAVERRVTETHDVAALIRLAAERRKEQQERDNAIDVS